MQESNRARGRRQVMKFAREGVRPETGKTNYHAARMILLEGTPEEIAAAESGKASLQGLLDTIKARRGNGYVRKGAKYRARQRAIVRQYRRAIVETEAGCVSLHTRVALPDTIDKETRDFALAALKRARRNLTRHISKISKGDPSNAE